MYISKEYQKRNVLFIHHEQGSAIKMEPVREDFYWFSLDFSFFVTVMSCVKIIQNKLSGIHISVHIGRCKK
jgi:CRISPR/Cas system-associated endonuclease Cas3-HD